MSKTPCNAEIKRRFGYGWSLCTRGATWYFTVESAGGPMTLHYCGRHILSHTAQSTILQGPRLMHPPTGVRRLAP